MDRLRVSTREPAITTAVEAICHQLDNAIQNVYLSTYIYTQKAGQFHMHGTWHVVSCTPPTITVVVVECAVKIKSLDRVSRENATLNASSWYLSCPIKETLTYSHQDDVLGVICQSSWYIDANTFTPISSHVASSVANGRVLSSAQTPMALVVPPKPDFFSRRP
jgi:hypothetical protein